MNIKTGIMAFALAVSPSLKSQPAVRTAEKVTKSVVTNVASKEVKNSAAKTYSNWTNKTEFSVGGGYGTKNILGEHIGGGKINAKLGQKFAAEGKVRGNVELGTSYAPKKFVDVNGVLGLDYRLSKNNYLEGNIDIGYSKLYTGKRIINSKKETIPNSQYLGYRAVYRPGVNVNYIYDNSKNLKARVGAGLGYEGIAGRAKIINAQDIPASNVAIRDVTGGYGKVEADVAASPFKKIKGLQLNGNAEYRTCDKKPTFGVGASYKF